MWYGTPGSTVRKLLSAGWMCFAVSIIRPFSSVMTRLLNRSIISSTSRRSVEKPAPIVFLKVNSRILSRWSCATETSCAPVRWLLTAFVIGGVWRAAASSDFLSRALITAAPQFCAPHESSSSAPPAREIMTALPPPSTRWTRRPASAESSRLQLHISSGPKDKAIPPNINFRRNYTPSAFL